MFDFTRSYRHLDQALSLDLRITATWSSKIDVDLCVAQPDGEECHTFHNHTKQGGVMSRDYPEGLGPIDYSLRFAPKGMYKVYARLYWQSTPFTVKKYFFLF